MTQERRKAERIRRLDVERRLLAPRAAGASAAVPSPHQVMVAEVTVNTGPHLQAAVQTVSGDVDGLQYADTDPLMTRDVIVIGGNPGDFAVGQKILIFRRGAYYFTPRAAAGDGVSIDTDQDGRLATQGVTDTIDLATATSITVANGLIVAYS
jgi:hypothetical protein